MTIDLTRKEHVATISRIVYENDDKTFVIMALDDGHSALGPGPSSQFHTGVAYRFMGRWEDDPKRGPRFRYTTSTLSTPAGRHGLVRYLTQLCEGIGEKRAGMIWDALGTRALEELRTGEPERISEQTGIPLDVILDAGKTLRENAATEATRVDLYELLNGRGFPGKLIPTAIKKWGAKAPDVIRRNPFALLGMPGGGFKRCDRMWLDLGHPPASLKRSALAMWDILRTDRNGNTWQAAETVAGELRARIPGADLVRSARLGVRSKLIRGRRDRNARVNFAEGRRAANEHAIAVHLARLAEAENLWPRALPISQRDGDRLPTHHQVERWSQATIGPCGILCGGPGTGKSHTLGFALRMIAEKFGPHALACCAPTGKAANRFTEAMRFAKVEVNASTIHTLLEIDRNGHDGNGWGFARNRFNPLSVRFLVIDEMSMVGVDLLASLLDACVKGTHVLFTGDPFQLPPVEHGAPLRDLLAARLPTGELTQVHRNAGQIVHACVRIKAGEQFEYSTKLDLEVDPRANLQVIECSSEEQIVESLTGLLSTSGKFDPVWQTQVIVPRNKGTATARIELNKTMHKLLNPNGHSRPKCPWLVGDKVICLRNTLLNCFEASPFAEDDDTRAENFIASFDEWGCKKQQYVANGEIGRVVAIGPGVAICRFSEREDLVEVSLSNKKPEDDDPDAGGDDDKDLFDLAYAVTGHKMQGSQAPRVIIVLDESGLSVANREWIYTAISRASKACVIITTRGVISRSVARVGLARRKTFLTDLVGEAITEPLKELL